MDSKQMGRGLTDGMDTLKKIGVALGALLVLLIVIYIIVGIFTKQVADGNIPVSSATNTSIQALEATLSTNVTSILANVPIIVGLVALVVILAVIGWLVFGKGKSGSKGGSNTF